MTIIDAEYIKKALNDQTKQLIDDVINNIHYTADEKREQIKDSFLSSSDISDIVEKEIEEGSTFDINFDINDVQEMRGEAFFNVLSKAK